MAKEKKFKDGKRPKKKKKGLSKKQRRAAASLKEKGLLSESSPSKPKRKKKRKAERRKRKVEYIGRGTWHGFDWVSWNRRQTTGIKVEELTPTTVVTEEVAFQIVEVNLNVDLKALKEKRSVKKKRTLRGLLNRSEL